MKVILFYLFRAWLTAGALAAPTTSTQPEGLSQRQVAVPSKITTAAQIESIVSGLETDAAAFAAGASILVDVLGAVVPSPAPSSIPDALSSIASVYAAHPSELAHLSGNRKFQARLIHDTCSQLRS